MNGKARATLPRTNFVRTNVGAIRDRWPRRTTRRRVPVQRGEMRLLGKLAGLFGRVAGLLGRVAGDGSAGAREEETMSRNYAVLQTLLLSAFAIVYFVGSGALLFPAGGAVRTAGLVLSLLGLLVMLAA